MERLKLCIGDRTVRTRCCKYDGEGDDEREVIGREHPLGMGASRALALQRCLQLVLVLLLLSIRRAVVVVVVGAQDVQGDITALLAIKAALVDSQSSLGNWTTSTPNAPCDWRGVWCTNGRVSELRLQTAGLQGPLAGRSPSQFLILWQKSGARARNVAVVVVVLLLHHAI